MKILVTGAGGFLGKRIVERLLAHGQTDVRAMLRDTSKGAALSVVAGSYPQAEVGLFSANLKNPAEIAAALQGVGMVIHSAAALKGSPAEMFLDSVVASRNLLDAVVAIPAEHRPRVVLISSFGVMGVAALGRGAVVDETVPFETRPGERDVYSYTKLRQEQLFWEYRDRYGFELVVLRPGVIYGPGGGHFSNRVGLSLFGRFVHLGHGNLLPLTYVDTAPRRLWWRLWPRLRRARSITWSTTICPPRASICGSTNSGSSRCGRCRCRIGCCTGARGWWSGTAGVPKGSSRPSLRLTRRRPCGAATGFKRQAQGLGWEAAGLHPRGAGANPCRFPARTWTPPLEERYG